MIAAKKGSVVTSSADLAGSYLRTLKARGAEIGVWTIRGRVFARVMVSARDARLSGAEWSILSTVALHLQHLGRSKGMMSVGSLADDCMVTERTVRNALRVLGASKFLSVQYRPSGQMTVMLDRRFGPKALVPVDKSVDKSPRRCAPRKKISTNGNSMLSFPLKRECKDSAPAKRPASANRPASIPAPQRQPATTLPVNLPIRLGDPLLALVADGRAWYKTLRRAGLAPPRKRARDPGS